MRMSLGNVEKLVRQLNGADPTNGNSLPMATVEMNEQLKLWQELEKQKRENEGLLSQLEELERDRKTNFVERGKKIYCKGLFRKLHCIEGRVRDA